MSAYRSGHVVSIHPSHLAGRTIRRPASFKSVTTGSNNCHKTHRGYVSTLNKDKGQKPLVPGKEIPAYFPYRDVNPSVIGFLIIPIIATTFRSWDK